MMLFRWGNRKKYAGASGLLSVSPPEEHYERLRFCRRGGNPIMCDRGSAIDS
jgi:hypothetical protein